MISPVSVGEPSRFLLPGFEGRPLAERAGTWPAADKGGGNKAAQTTSGITSLVDFEV